MKKFILATFAAFGLLTLIFLGCKKDTDIFTPDGTPAWDTTLATGNIESFFAGLRQAPEHFTFDAGQSQIFRTKKGTLIEIQANSLWDGTTVAGQVEMDFLEFYDQGSMILFDRPTQTHQNRLLLSDGVFFIEITQNGEPLGVYGTQPIAVRFQRPDPDPEMRLFEGSANSDGAWRWYDEWDEAIAPASWTDTLVNTPSFPPPVTGYFFSTSDLGWINCDAFAEVPPSDLTNVCVSLPAEFTNLNARVYLVFKNRNSVMNLRGNPELKSFCVNNVPLGEEVIVVAIGVQENEQHFFKHLPIAITADMDLELALEPSTKADILKFLEEL